MRAAMVQRQDSGGWADTLQGVKSCAISIASQVRETQSAYLNACAYACNECCNLEWCLASVHVCALWFALCLASQPLLARSHAQGLCATIRTRTVGTAA